MVGKEKEKLCRQWWEKKNEVVFDPTLVA